MRENGRHHHHGGDEEERGQGAQRPHGHGHDGHSRHGADRRRDDHDRNRAGGKHGGHGGSGYESLVQEEGTHLLFVGSRSCVRHKGTQKHRLQREGKLTFFCPDEVDWITGAYLGLMEEAIAEVVQEVKPAHLVVFGGCQIELLSTDYEAMMKQQREQYGIDIRFHRGCHLIGYGEELERRDRQKQAGNAAGEKEGGSQA